MRIFVIVTTLIAGAIMISHPPKLIGIIAAVLVICGVTIMMIQGAPKT